MKTTTLAAIAAAASTAAGAPSSGVIRRQDSSGASIQAGGLLSFPGDTVTSVSGAFHVPKLSIPVSGPHANRKGGIYAFSIYVGIGGSPGFGVTTGCTGELDGVIRAGIDVYYNGFDDNDMMPFAWYEAGQPTAGGGFGYAGFNLEAGDLIRLTASAEGNSLNATIENFGKVESTAGRTPIQSDRPTYGINEAAAATVCRSEGGWIVQDHMTETEPSLPVILANFTNVDFQELSIKTKSGAAGSATTAKLLNMVLPDQGGQLTECSATSATALSCKRVVVQKPVPRADGATCEE